MLPVLHRAVLLQRKEIDGGWCTVVVKSVNICHLFVDAVECLPSQVKIMILWDKALCMWISCITEQMKCSSAEYSWCHLRRHAVFMASDIWLICWFMENYSKLRCCLEYWIGHCASSLSTYWSIWSMRRSWSVMNRSSVPDGVTFTYPQHLVPVEGDIDIPSNSTDAKVFFPCPSRQKMLCFSIVIRSCEVRWYREVAGTSTTWAGRWCSACYSSPQKPLIVFSMAQADLGHSFWRDWCSLVPGHLYLNSVLD